MIEKLASDRDELPNSISLLVQNSMTRLAVAPGLVHAFARSGTSVREWRVLSAPS
jgi:hypothetical protein